MFTGQEPKAPRIPAVGEKLGEVDGWVSSDNPYEGFSPDPCPHHDGCDCPDCSMK